MGNRAYKLAETFDRAVSAFRAGKFIKAERLCRQIISAKPDFFDAVHLLAVVQSALGKHDLALVTYDRALVLRPDYAEALYNRGNSLTELKRFEEAVATYDRALALNPQYPEALYNRGNCLRALNRLIDALTSYDRALALRPDHTKALINRSNTLAGLKQFDEALVSYDRALILQPDNATVLTNRGNTLAEMKRFDEALVSYDRALILQPDNADILTNRGNTLAEMKRFDEALANYDRALAAQTDYSEAFSGRGNVLVSLRRFEEALIAYDGAFASRPNFAGALSNRGNALTEMARFGEAQTAYDRALALQPDFADAHWNEALLRLLTGDFARGWSKYEWRWEYGVVSGLTKPNFPQPLWLGEGSIAGKTILLHSEQGFGDTIHFSRYVPLVAACGADVILEVQAPLQVLLTSLAGASKVIAKGNPLPDFDVHCSLLSLPLAFGTQLETIPCDQPYLTASPQALENWNARLGPKRAFRIGLVWSGNAGHRRDRDRSLRLQTLLPLLDIGATFVSLQKEVRSDDAAILKDHSNIVDFADALEDFADTAALISNLDLVISADTSVAHLAGALGKPVWILLSYVPDWRWLLDRDDSPWYPTARLFRQNDTREWDSVIARVRDSLLTLIENGG